MALIHSISRTMLKTDKRTIVGVPFYDGEGIDVLTACLKDIDRCLNNLKIDAKVIVGINGPRVSLGEQKLSHIVDRSRYNAEIEFIKTEPGMVAAINAICQLARREGYQRVFLTDADISRMPMSLYDMWNQGDKSVVGVLYSTYPSEILKASGLDFTQNELAFMRIFEADKHPLAREFTRPFRPVKRLKGSLLLVDTQAALTMFGDQRITTDSRMNRLISDKEKQLISSTGFMHYPRISMMDHIQARLRHYRAAASEKDLQTFMDWSLMYKPNVAETIAQDILRKHPEAFQVASDFLLQCALRYHVNIICSSIVFGTEADLDYDTHWTMETTPIVTGFDEAYGVVKKIIGRLDLASLNSMLTFGEGVTQENMVRVPINLDPFLASDYYKKIIFTHLGLNASAKKQETINTSYYENRDIHWQGISL